MTVPDNIKRAFYWTQVGEPYNVQEVDAYIAKIMAYDDADKAIFLQFVEDYYESTSTTA